MEENDSSVREEDTPPEIKEKDAPILESGENISSAPI